ncbi:MAG: xanthine dehydrogenase family protein subunit M [Hyphomicrobiaceae bacterium]
MRNFNYHRPSDIGAAAAELGKASDPRLLAGGMSLLPSLKLRLAEPSDLIDLNAIEGLKGIKVEGKEVVIGAMTRHAEVAASADVKKAIPALAELADGIADPAVRNRGTLGGSIANADPAADYPAGVVGLDAVVKTNTREIPADEFFVGLFTTALEPGEIVTSVRFKAPDKAKYLKLRHPASGFAVAGVMVAKYGSNVRVAVTGAGPSVFRVPDMEKALASSFTPEAIASIKVDDGDLMTDIHFSAEYRANAVGVLARRAVAAIA